ncbi:hypothetical protein ACNSTU_05685 [Aquisalimonas sp. APHAB1-3]|uniref:hypothetical protein n=1 Tax=unclassified Aquisalimonas TaxID=2644645 RepID=UPI0025BAA9AF|nr:hypothetical protein [Aquisalimonas sp.]
MALITPQRFLRFAAEQYPLLRELLDTGAVTEPELMASIGRHRRPADPEPSTIRENLLAMGFLERRPESDVLEFPQPLERFLRYLHREHHLTSASQLESYVEDIARLESELNTAVAAPQSTDLPFVLEELAARIEEIRHDIAGNKEAITDAVIRFQANPDALSLQARYARVIWLWERYLVPVQELIDTERVMEEHLNSLDRSMLDAEGALAAERPDLAGGVRENRLRLYRMRRQIVDDFRESMLELQPLYQRAMRESETARDVSHVLDHVRRHGAGSLALEERVGAPVSRHEGLFGDLAAKAYLYRLADFQPRGRVELDAALEDGGEPINRVDLTTLFGELESEQPDDALEWLVDSLADRGGSVRDLLTVFGRAVRRLETQPGSEPRDYQFGDYTLRTYPRSLTNETMETDHERD